jgi:hypothetical protein
LATYVTIAQAGLFWGTAMAIELADYSNPARAIRWFDIDPRFDNNWTSWAQHRVYAYIPSLSAMLDDLAPVNFTSLAEIANVRMAETGAAHGIIKNERLIAGQIKVAAGLKGRPGTTDARPLRVDKALLILFAINSELDRLGHPQIKPTIYLSAFNISGLSAAFNALSAKQKEDLRTELATVLEQPDELASDLLKGNKVSLDLAIRTYQHLSPKPGFKDKLGTNLLRAIETPTRKHTTASGFEMFEKGRLNPLPVGFKRP